MKTNQEPKSSSLDEAGGSWQFKFLISVIAIGLLGILLRALGLV